MAEFDAAAMFAESPVAMLATVGADGHAEIHYSGDEMARGYSLLRTKYVQYQRVALDGPVVTIDVKRWASWQA